MHRERPESVRGQAGATPGRANRVPGPARSKFLMNATSAIRETISLCKLKISRLCHAHSFTPEVAMRFQEALSNTQAELELKELDKQPDPYVGICEEADIITKGSRNLAYGAPSDDFKRMRLNTSF